MFNAASRFKPVYTATKVMSDCAQPAYQLAASSDNDHPSVSLTNIWDSNRISAGANSGRLSVEAFTAKYALDHSDARQNPGVTVGS